MSKLKTIFLLCLAAISTQFATAQTVVNKYGAPDNFSDMVLIYAGNPDRNSWNTKQLTPYVTHTFTDGHEQWLFDAFLFLEFVRPVTLNGVSTSVGFGNGMGGAHYATQADWKWILDEYITTGNSYNTTKLAALDQLIEEKKKTLGQPPHRHKVVIVCPAPKKEGSAWSSDVWGTVNGRSLRFNKEADRLDAVKWYIDQLVERFNAANYANIDLEGIYWVEESMISNAGIIANVNNYARSKGLRTYWIPYYRDGNEQYCRQWKDKFGFDMAYFQPNYAFYTETGGTMPISQLSYTCEGAKKYGAGLELEFETSGTSNALHSENPQLHQHINDYMDVYTEQGVFDQAGVAYYVGSRGLNHMRASTDPVDHATMDRMATIVADRQKARYGNSSALEKININNNDWAFAGKGCIVTSAEASCYDTAGRLVHQGIGLFECKPGFYIVQDANGNSAKLTVK